MHQDLLSLAPQPVSAVNPLPYSDNLPVPYLYMLSHLSKLLIRQAENEVLAKAEAAFPLAKIVMGLLLRGHASLSDILCARFVKKCPWVLPYYPPQAPVSCVGSSFNSRILTVLLVSGPNSRSL